MSKESPQRFGHTATLIDNKLYILGGQSIAEEKSAIVGKGFFYLDVAVEFNTQNLLWHDLSSVNTVPSLYGATSVKGGVNNNTLFSYGGYASTDTNKALLVYTFDTQSSSWTIPNVTNTVRKYDLKGIIDNSGKMYLWGGMVAGGVVNDMQILDTMSFNWGKGSSDGVPTERRDYGAVLLPDRKLFIWVRNPCKC